MYIHLSGTMEINFIQAAASKTTATTGFGQFLFLFLFLFLSTPLAANFFCLLSSSSGATGDGNAC